MFGAYGGITFTVLGGPTKMEFDDHSEFAKLDVVGAPPTLQWIYDDLTKADLDILLHQMWTSPADAIAAFQQQRLTHRPQPLVFGIDNRGNFVLEGIKEQDIWRADDGTIIATRLRLSLRQWAGTLPQSAPVLPTQSNALGTTTAGPGATPLQAQQPIQEAGPASGDFTDAPLSTATRIA
jgi:hypothetical protein